MLLLTRLFIGVIFCGSLFAAETTRYFKEDHLTDLEGREWLISNYFVNKEQKWPFRKIGQKVDAHLSFESGAFKGSPGCGQVTGIGWTVHHLSGLDR